MHSVSCCARVATRAGLSCKASARWRACTWTSVMYASPAALTSRMTSSMGTSVSSARLSADRRSISWRRATAIRACSATAKRAIMAGVKCPSSPYSSVMSPRVFEAAMSPAICVMSTRTRRLVRVFARVSSLAFTAWNWRMVTAVLTTPMSASGATTGSEAATGMKGAWATMPPAPMTAEPTPDPSCMSVAGLAVAMKRVGAIAADAAVAPSAVAVDAVEPRT